MRIETFLACALLSLATALPLGAQERGVAHEHAPAQERLPAQQAHAREAPRTAPAPSARKDAASLARNDLASARSLFSASDADKDGSISQPEATSAGISRQVFQVLDHDADALVSTSEFIVGYRQALAQAKRPVEADLESEATRLLAIRKARVETRRQLVQSTSDPAGARHAVPVSTAPAAQDPALKRERLQNIEQDKAALQRERVDNIAKDEAALLRERLHNAGQGEATQHATPHAPAPGAQTHAAPGHAPSALPAQSPAQSNGGGDARRGQGAVQVRGQAGRTAGERAPAARPGQQAAHPAPGSRVPRQGEHASGAAPRPHSAPSQHTGSGKGSGHSPSARQAPRPKPATPKAKPKAHRPR